MKLGIAHRDGIKRPTPADDSKSASGAGEEALNDNVY